jgi:hypothetical protein
VNKTPSAGFTADEIRGISETKSEMWWVDAIGANQFFFDDCRRAHLIS